MAQGTLRFPSTALRSRSRRGSPGLLFTLLALVSGAAGANETEWLSRFGTPDYDSGGGIVRHSTGVYVAGSQASNAFVRRYDPDGHLVWKREYAFGTYGTSGGPIAVDDTGVYVAGNDDFGGFVRKYDLDGNHQWTRHLYREEDRLTSLAGVGGIAVHSTGIYLVGASSPDCTDGCLTNAVVARLDLAGNELWTAVAGRPFDHPFGYRHDSVAYDVAVDAAGVYVSGVLGDADVRRYSFDGARTGSLGPGSLWGAGLALDASGIYLVGLPCPDACQFATTVRKYDRSGRELWNRDLPQPFEAGTSIALQGGWVYVAGNLWKNFPDGPYLAYVRKYDTDGGFIWSDEFGVGNGTTQAGQIALDETGVYMTGTAYAPTADPPNSDAFVIKRNEGTTSRTRLLSLGDINDDGTPELAAAGHDSQDRSNWVVVKDASTRRKVSDATMADTLPPADVARVPDLNGNGAPEIALLSATTVSAQIRDSSSGAPLGTVDFDSTYEPIRLASLPRRQPAGTPMLALLAEKNGTVRVEVRNAPGGGLAIQIPYASSQLYQPRDLAVLADLNANGAVEVAVLQHGTAADRSDRVEIRDSLTGELVRNVSFGVEAAQPRQLLAIADVNGNGAPELAVLRNGSARVDVRDARSGALISSLAFGKAYTPIRIAAVPDYSGNHLPELALLQAHPSDGAVRIAVYDIATRQWLGAAYYGNSAIVRPDDLAVLPDITGNGVPELVRLGVRVSDGTVVAAIRDALSGPAGGEIRFYP